MVASVGGGGRVAAGPRQRRAGAVSATVAGAGGGDGAWAERQRWRQGDTNQVFDEMPTRDVVRVELTVVEKPFLLPVGNHPLVPGFQPVVAIRD
ncbi:hypothetical protein [Oryza sativa Japonica Group]|uniref:Uncharacterized protein n=2 Tax=Oryza sativa subsp. japonica TaxID=39947 RepID=Q7F146_ORYSJ|nr:hypothetical protein [Oryza sativa Japonica Group]BAB92856.1 hypothetical protein [Oryza sativa Japonica Group]